MNWQEGGATGTLEDDEMGGQSPPTLRAYRAEHKNMWSRGTSTGHLVNLDEKWALAGITEISSPSPS